jgi:hypothetical protein
VDQNFERMDGIVNPDYYKTVSPAPPSIISTLNNNNGNNNMYRNESFGNEMVIIN